MEITGKSDSYVRMISDTFITSVMTVVSPIPWWANSWQTLYTWHLTNDPFTTY